jgi:5S rRNA maturation endonuclease (ribonuclease M5)
MITQTSNRVKIDKNNPCPHCGKPDWCYMYTAEDGNLLSVCNRDYEPAPGWEKSTKLDSQGKPIYYLKKEIKFSAYKEEKTQYFLYPPLASGVRVRVYRKDYQEDGIWKKDIKQQHSTNNGKWKWGIGDIQYKDIPLYHGDHLEKAIKEGTQIFVVEGETKVEKLESFGLVATCNIGGSKKWQQSHTEALKGANLILCPDRDKGGVTHCQKIYQDFPEAKWLYAYPDSPLWDHLPESQGVDIINWIEEKKITLETLLSSIVDKPKEIKEKKGKEVTVTETMTFQDLITAIDGCIGQDEITRTQWQEKVDLWAKATGKTPTEIRHLIEIRRTEIAEGDAIKTGLEGFLRGKHYQKKEINLFEILPQPLAEAIISRAKTLNQPPIRLLHSLWPILGAVLGSRFAINLRTTARDRECWKEYPIFYCADAGGVSSGKTTTQKEIYKVLKRKDLDELERLSKKQARLKELKAEWSEMTREERSTNKENSEVNPSLYEKENCQSRRWFYDEGTFDGVLKTMSTQPRWQGGVWVADELTGLFEGLNQYRSGGKGNDRQRLLSSWNDPVQNTFDRVKEENRYFLNGQTINILGGIQIQKVQKYLDLSNDVDGLVSRFLFLLHEPLDPQRGRPPEDPNSIQECIQNIINQISGINLEADEDGIIDPYNCWFTEIGEDYAFGIKYHYEMLIKKYRVTNPSFASYIGKQMKTFLRLTLAIHLLNWIFDPDNTNLYKIPVQTAKKAARMTDFYISQFLTIQGVTSHDENPVQGILSEIWEIVKTTGKMTPREVVGKFGGRKINGEKVNTSIAYTLLTQLEQAGYGRLEVKSRGMVLHHQEPKELETFEIEDESLEYQSEIKEEIEVPTPTPKPEPVSDPEIVEVESEPVDELSADGVHIDSLPDLEKETVLIRTAASVEIGERTIPPRAVGKVIEATFDTFDNQWLLRVETILNGSAITFIIPFSNCYLQGINT